jgi:hypothetical protein
MTLANAYMTFDLAYMTFANTYMSFDLAYMTFANAYMTFDLAYMTFANAFMTFGLHAIRQRLHDIRRKRNVPCEHAINMDSGLLLYQ